MYWPLGGSCGDQSHGIGHLDAVVGAETILNINKTVYVHIFLIIDDILMLITQPFTSHCYAQFINEAE